MLVSITDGIADPVAFSLLLLPNAVLAFQPGPFLRLKLTKAAERLCNLAGDFGAGFSKTEEGLPLVR